MRKTTGQLQPQQAYSRHKRSSGSPTTHLILSSIRITGGVSGWADSYHSLSDSFIHPGLGMLRAFSTLALKARRSHIPDITNSVQQLYSPPHILATAHLHWIQGHNHRTWLIRSNQNLSHYQYSISICTHGRPGAGQGAGYKEGKVYTHIEGRIFITVRERIRLAWHRFCWRIPQ